MVSLLPLLVAFQVAAAVPPEIENEQILGINKEPWHSTLMPYASLSEALAARRDRSSYTRSLNGPWKFHWVNRPEQRPMDFYRSDFDDRSWKTIPVPSNWQVLGYGTPYYRNAGYTFQRDWPRVMSEPPKNFTAYVERNPVGSYRRTFEVPAGWSGRRTFLTFDGVDSAFFLWVNGKKVGYSSNSRNPAEFDVTSYVHPGKNLVAAEVYRYSSGSYFEDQDMWRLSGIFRNVRLWSSPQTHVRDYFVKTDLDHGYRDAQVRISAKVRNYGVSSQPLDLVATLYDARQRPVTAARTKVAPIVAGSEREVSLSFSVKNPEKWSAEKPNLYTLVLSTAPAGGSDEPVELLSSRVGFRKVEIKGRLFMLNGVPIKLKGANRHEHWPDTGHYVSEARMIRDIEVLKQANCNHVRTCHYSDDPRWYELCDQYGLYLVAEANAECHGYYGVLDREPRFEKMIVDRNVANTENFKNHASIVMWSLGNECGGGSNFRSALRAVKAIDNTRPVHYEAFGIGANNPADVDSQMYTDPAGVERHAQDVNLTKPYYMCEYAHAMNNSMGSIGDYNDVFDKYPALMGGAIWEWEDQGLWNRRDPKRPYLAYGGGFGEEPNDGFFIHKGVVFSDRSPKPHFPEAKRAYQWVRFESSPSAPKLITIHNKYAFTNLKELDFSWSVVGDGVRVAGGKIPSMDVRPGGRRMVELPISGFDIKPGQEYWLNIAASLRHDEPWAKAGYEVANAQFQLPYQETAKPAGAAQPVSLAENSTRVTVTGQGFKVVFDKSTGELTALESAGRNVLLPGGGPRLHLWRAQHRNDDNYAARDWNRAGLRGLKRSVVGTSVQHLSSNAVQITSTVRYEGTSGFAADHTAAYTVYGDGTVAVDNSVSPYGRKLVLAHVGVRMLLDRGLDRVSYLGRGPMENYSDRKRGSDIGLYSSSVVDQLTPYSKPMEAGNHEDTRWVALSGAGLPALTATAERESPMQFSALPYTDEELDEAPYRVDLPKSQATVLCLSAKTLGVGSNSCGPRPLPQYMVDSSPALFSYALHLGPKPIGRWTAPEERPRPAIAALLTAQKLSVAGPGTLRYSTNGGPWRTYADPFSVEEGATVRVMSTAPNGRSVTATFRVPVRKETAVARVTASSFEPGEGEPENAIDGDPSTYWHSRWNPKADPPHTLTLELREPQEVSRVKVVPRQDMANGRVREYELFLSEDGQTWGEPASKGTMPNGQRDVMLLLDRPRRAKFVRLVVRSDHSGGNFAAVAEIEVLSGK
jgi:beta-galactosidase